MVWLYNKFGIQMSNTKNTFLVATILVLSNCSSYKGVYDSTSYIDKSDAKSALKVKANMHPNISNKHKVLYAAPHINLYDYIDPDVAKNKTKLPKYRLYLASDITSAYTKAQDAVSKLKYSVVEANETKKYIIVKVNNEKYKIQLVTFEKGTVIYVINEQSKIVLQSKFKKLFDLIA